MVFASDSPRHTTHSQYRPESPQPLPRPRSSSRAQVAGTSAASHKKRVEADASEDSNPRGAEPAPVKPRRSTILAGLEKAFPDGRIPPDIWEDYMDSEYPSDLEEGACPDPPEPPKKTPKREPGHRRRRKPSTPDDGIYVNFTHGGTSGRAHTSYPHPIHTSIHVNSGNMNGQTYDGGSYCDPGYTGYHGRSNHFDRDAFSCGMNQSFLPMNLFPQGIPGLNAGLGAGINASIASSLDSGANNVIINSFNSYGNTTVDDNSESDEGEDKRHGRRGKKKANSRTRER